VRDPRIEGVTLTGIEVSRDLKYAKIFFSLIGGSEEVNRAKAGMESAKGFIKREIGLRMELKYIPELVFRHDPTLEKGTHMEMLFERLKNDEKSGSGD
jgi:ribosome-binding factor A